MPGYLALLLHAHLPFVRHPEHERFLEESWLFEAITETYLPLIELLRRWQQDQLAVKLTLTLSPTLGAMLGDPLLRSRYERHLTGLIELAGREIVRTRWERSLAPLADRYYRHFQQLHACWQGDGGDLVGVFRALQDQGRLEIITCAATHALLPLLASHRPSQRAQLLGGRDQYRECFGCDPKGVWLPECAYVPELEPVLQEANLRWFVLDTHGLLRGDPRPHAGPFAPVWTPNGLAVFARDPESAQQVWSRHGGYPGDPRYRDFYRDIGFDLEWDYVRPWLPSPAHRGFTGLKYYRITGGPGDKQPYDPAAARKAATEHAEHFLSARLAQCDRLAGLMARPPLLLMPYDAELFGHWWHEGLDFLDAFVRLALRPSTKLSFITPSDYLRQYPTNQVVKPSTSSWGEEGYWRVWLNEKNEWILPHLRVAQERMTELARRSPEPPPLEQRALRQASRELLLAQASDWPFLLHTGTSLDYARHRVTDHLVRFNALFDQLTSGRIDEPGLAQLEAKDNLFPETDWRYWA